jgi:hypothetical protein
MIKGIKGRFFVKKRVLGWQKVKKFRENGIIPAHYLDARDALVQLSSVTIAVSPSF